MAYGTSPEHTTVPRDPGLAFDPSGTAHLLIATACGTAAQRLVADWRAQGDDTPLTVLHDGCAAALVEEARLTATEAEPGDLEDALALLLAEARVGVRVYVTGPEAFLRTMGRLALRAGLEPGELQTEVAGPRARRVWCSHCSAITEGARENLLACRACGVTLLVFDHFSRRHAAYLGFQADAEVPGDLPPRQELTA